MEERDADHCEDSQNLLLGDKFFFVVLDDIS
jgi:hypothetical protein